jgi:hypothetical protein
MVDDYSKITNIYEMSDKDNKVEPEKSGFKEPLILSLQSTQKGNDGVRISHPFSQDTTVDITIFDENKNLLSKKERISISWGPSFNDLDWDPLIGSFYEVVNIRVSAECFVFPFNIVENS